MSSDATTKGTVLRGLRKFIDAELTPAQRESVLRALPPGDRTVVEQQTILATQLISEFTLNRLTVEAAKVKGETLDSFGRRAGRAELKDALGILRFLTVVLTPTALMKKASSAWATIHSHGKLVVEEGDHTARVKLVEFPSEPAHCARLTGWFEGAAEMTGVRNLRIVHDLCVARGNADCQWQLDWRK